MNDNRGIMAFMGLLILLLLIPPTMAQEVRGDAVHAQNQELMPGEPLVIVTKNEMIRDDMGGDNLTLQIISPSFQTIFLFSYSMGEHPVQNLTLITGEEWEQGVYLIYITTDKEATNTTGEDADTPDATFVLRRGEQFVVTGPQPPLEPSGEFIKGIIGIAVGASVIALILGTELGKYILFAFLLAPLYTRIRKDNVLDHETRGRLFQFIKEYPGVNFTRIRMSVIQKNGKHPGHGTLVYHLKKLVDEGEIQVKHRGIMKLYFPSGMNLEKFSKLGEDLVSSLQITILSVIHNGNELCQKDITNQLNKMGFQGKYHAVGFHLRKMRRRNFILMERKKRKKVYSINHRSMATLLGDIENEIRWRPYRVKTRKQDIKILKKMLEGNEPKLQKN